MPTERPSSESGDEKLIALASQDDAEIFELLLQGSQGSEWDNLVAKIAYAEYARSKYKFIKSYYEEHQVMPSDEEMRPIIFLFKNVNTGMLRDLKSKSQDSLRLVLDDYSQKMLIERVSSPVEQIVKDNTKFWVGVQASMVASFFYSLLIALIIFIATAALPNTKFSEAIKILFEIEQVDEKDDIDK